MEEKYTFEDWFSGKVNLKSEHLFETNKNTPIITELSNFSKDDQTKILKAKEDIFNDLVSNQGKRFMEVFKNFHNNAVLKESHLENKIDEIYDLLFEEFIPNGLPYASKFQHSLFQETEIINIKNLIRSHFLEGNEFDYTFIHSPKSKFNQMGNSEKIIPFEVNAFAYISFFEELKKMRKLANNDETTPNRFNTEKLIRQEKKKNNYYEIFINPKAFKLFNLVLRFSSPKKAISDFSFLFYSFQQKNLFKPNIELTEYIDYIGVNHKKDLDKEDFRSRGSQIQKHLFIEFYKEYLK